MAPPGTIIYAHPPDEAGWSFFYVVYWPAQDAYAVRCRRHGGEALTVEGSAGEVVSYLEGPLAASLPHDGAVPLQAARALRAYL